MGRRYRAVLRSYWESRVIRQIGAWAAYYCVWSNFASSENLVRLVMSTSLIPAILMARAAKHHLADPRATLIPRFRCPHVVIALAVMALIILISAIFMSLEGVSPFGALARSVCVAAFGICCYHAASYGPFALLVTGGVFMLALPERWSGPTALILGSAIIAVWAWRLMHLHEVISDDQTKPSETLNIRPPFTDRKLERRIKAARSEGQSHYTLTKVAWQRVLLRRLDLDEMPHWRVVIISFCILVLLAIEAKPDLRKEASEPRQWLCMLCFFIASLGPFVYASSVWGHRHRLAHESLRPCSKSQFFSELGLAVALNAIQVWIGLVIGCAITGVIWVHELISPEGLVLLLLSAGGLVLNLGLTAWATSLRLVLSQGGVILLSLVVSLAPGILVATHPNLAYSLQSWIIVASVMALIGLAYARFAHLSWCEMELG